MSDRPNPARELADSGTPGPWADREGDLEGGTLLDYVSTLFANRDDGTSTGRLFLALAHNTVDPEKGATVVPAMTGDGPHSEANATKIVRAVNALPAIADLLSVISGHVACDCCPDDPRCLACGSGDWPCSTARAREAVEAALRGDA